MFENIKVVKRDGKKVDFDGSKIALAIKKGFDSVALDEEEQKYSEKDIIYIAQNYKKIQLKKSIDNKTEIKYNLIKLRETLEMSLVKQAKPKSVVY